MALPCLDSIEVRSQVLLGVGEAGLVLRQLGDGLIEGGLERRRIDLHEQVALLDHLPFLEADLLDLSVHPRAHGHRVGGLHRAQPAQNHRKRPSFHDSNVDRGSGGPRLRRGGAWSKMLPGPVCGKKQAAAASGQRQRVNRPVGRCMSFPNNTVIPRAVSTGGARLPAHEDARGCTVRGVLHGTDENAGLECAPSQLTALCPAVIGRGLSARACHPQRTRSSRLAAVRDVDEAPRLGRTRLREQIGIKSLTDAGHEFNNGVHKKPSH